MGRTGKFYRNNEAEVMKRYGLRPTKNSGSGWIEKEDGENEDVICQLKSTDADSIKINLLDLHKLIYHAKVSHKIPIFMIQFIEHNEEYILIKADDIYDVFKGLKQGGQYKIITEVEEPSDIIMEHASVPVRKVKSSNNKTRNKFYIEKEKMYAKFKNKN